uniref:Uncharacterized protein n=1 Tax=Aegilops tauschii subsp. strangulata TaxID=200361 RepID=A0A453PES4_AEGTS
MQKLQFPAVNLQKSYKTTVNLTAAEMSCLRSSRVPCHEQSLCCLWARSSPVEHQNFTSLPCLCTKDTVYTRSGTSCPFLVHGVNNLFRL